MIKYYEMIEDTFCHNPFVRRSKVVKTSLEGSSDAASPLNQTTLDNAKEGQNILIKQSAYNVAQLMELQCHREEVDRELTIETALMRVELDEAKDKLRQSDIAVEELDQAILLCEQQIDDCAVQLQEQTAEAGVKLTERRKVLHRLRSRLECIEVNLDDDGNEDDELRTEIWTAVDKMGTLLKAEQKMFDDLEIKLLEDEAKLQGKREKLTRNLAMAKFKNLDCQTRVRSLEEQLDQISRDSLNQLKLLSANINTIELSIQQKFYLKSVPVRCDDNGLYTDNPPCQGFLKKLSGKNSGLCRWSKKWFVLERQNGILSYYCRKFDESQEREMGKSINLQDTKEIYVDHKHDKKGLQGRVFVLKTTQRTMRLSAATEQAVAVWVDAISAVARRVVKNQQQSQNNLSLKC